MIERRTQVIFIIKHTNSENISKWATMENCKTTAIWSWSMCVALYGMHTTSHSSWGCLVHMMPHSKYASFKMCTVHAVGTSTQEQQIVVHCMLFVAVQHADVASLLRSCASCKAVYCVMYMPGVQFGRHLMQALRSYWKLILRPGLTAIDFAHGWD